MNETCLEIKLKRKDPNTKEQGKQSVKEQEKNGKQGIVYSVEFRKIKADNVVKDEEQELAATIINKEKLKRKDPNTNKPR